MSDSFHVIWADKLAFPSPLPGCKWYWILPIWSGLINWPFPFSFQIVSDSWILSIWSGLTNLIFPLYCPGCMWCGILPIWFGLTIWLVPFTFQLVSDVGSFPSNLGWQFDSFPFTFQLVCNIWFFLCGLGRQFDLSPSFFRVWVVSHLSHLVWLSNLLHSTATESMSQMWTIYFIIHFIIGKKSTWTTCE